MGSDSTGRFDLRAALADLWRDGRGWILLAIAGGWFFSLGVRLIYPALVPFLRAEFGMDLTTIGLLLTVLWGAYALGQLPGGVLGDRIGEGNILVISTAISAITILVVGLSTGVRMLFAATVAFGLATALYGPTRFTIFTDLYPDRSGSAIGLTMATGSAGNTLLPVAAVLVATYATWRLSFGVVFPFFAGAAVALWLVVPSRTSSTSNAVDEFSFRTVRRIAGGVVLGSIPIVVAIQLCLSFVFQGFVGFYPTYLTDVKGLSPALSSALFGTFFASSILIQPIAGFGMDRFGPRRTLIATLMPITVGLWLLPFAGALVHLVGITLLLSSLSGFGVITQTFIADALPADMKGTGLGMLRTSWMLLGATCPVLIGILGDFGYLRESFFLLAGFASVGLSLAVFRF